MDSTVPRSTIPVAVTVASEQEPVECEGAYTERADGFILEFSIASDKFTIEHTSESTRIVASGVVSYDIELNDCGSTTLLATPYGKIRFDVKCSERKIERSADSLKIALGYVLSSEVSDEICRAVDITVRFSIC